MDIQEIAPKDDTGGIWKYDHKAKRWTRYPGSARIFTDANGKPATLRELHVKSDLSELGSANRQTYRQAVHNIGVWNQEANAWGHDNYNNFHYYKTDTTHQPDYAQYLDSMSKDQLNRGAKYWQHELLSKHYFKNYNPNANLDRANNPNYIGNSGSDTAQRGGVGDQQRFDINCDYLNHLMDNDNSQYSADAGFNKLNNWNDRFIGKHTAESINQKYFPQSSWQENTRHLQTYVRDLVSIEQTKVAINNSTKHGAPWTEMVRHLKQQNKQAKNDRILWQDFIAQNSTLPLGKGNSIKIKAGDTYSRISQIYHIPIATLERLNKYPAKDLPQGARMILNSKGMKGKSAFNRLLGAINSGVTGLLGRDIAAIDHDKIRIQQYQRMVQRRINQSIHNQIRANAKKGLTSIWRRDHKTDTVIAFAEFQPQETLDMNTATQPVDANMPQSDFNQINNRQLTDQGDIYQPTDADRVNKYVILMHWEEHSIQLCISGFNHWGSFWIQSLSRSPDMNATANGISVNMTIQYVRLARIVFSKQVKPKGQKRKGRNKRKSNTRTVRIKPGNTYWGLMKGNTAGIKEAEKMNPKMKARDLPIGGKLVLPK